MLDPPARRSFFPNIRIALEWWGSGWCAGYIPGVVGVGVACWHNSWDGEGRGGVLGIFLGWWGSGWGVGYIPGVVRVGVACWVYSWGDEGRGGVLGIFLGW